MVNFMWKNYRNTVSNNQVEVFEVSSCKFKLFDASGQSIEVDSDLISGISNPGPKAGYVLVKEGDDYLFVEPAYIENFLTPITE